MVAWKIYKELHIGRVFQQEETRHKLRSLWHTRLSRG